MKKFFFLFFVLIFFPSFAISDSIFLSLKKNKFNLRYGPVFDYEVKYIYKKKNLPLKILDKKGNWRKIIDIKKNGGWIHWSQLKKINSFVTLDEKILFLKPSLFSKPIAKIQEGRLLLVDKCITNWCKIKTEEYSGWVDSVNLWGKIP